MPEFGRQSQFPIQSPTVERAAEFLAQGRGNRERLGCADCLTAELCAALVTGMTSRSKDRPVPGKDAGTLCGYGIQVDKDGCRPELATVALAVITDFLTKIAAQEPSPSA
jgi:hypothetical protein